MWTHVIQPPFPHVDASSLTPLMQTVLKTLRQMKKLLKTSNFPFCHHVFNSIQLLFFHLKGFSVLLLNVFNVVSCRFDVCGKELKSLLQIRCMWERVKVSVADVLYVRKGVSVRILKQTSNLIFCHNVSKSIQ